MNLLLSRYPLIHTLFPIPRPLLVAPNSERGLCFIKGHASHQNPDRPPTHNLLHSHGTQCLLHMCHIVNMSKI